VLISALLAPETLPLLPSLSFGAVAQADSRLARISGNSNEVLGNAADVFLKGSILLISGAKYSYIGQNFSMPSLYSFLRRPGIYRMFLFRP
jgi:Na+-transporting methylmalonyl-CoA/oxaloacetate decarboxylase beta subunit